MRGWIAICETTGMPPDVNQLTQKIIGAAIQVHRELGPGLLESAYQGCLEFELRERGLLVEPQVAVPLTYRGHNLGTGYRLDLLVERAVVIEVKSVEKIEPVHLAQVLSYLRLSGHKIGLLMNFNVKWLVDQGLKRLINGRIE